MSYFVYYEDSLNNCHGLETFESKEKAEQFIVDNQEHVIGVIEGRLMKVVDVEVVKKVRLER